MQPQTPQGCVVTPVLQRRARNLRRRLSRVADGDLTDLIQAQSALVSLEVAMRWEGYRDGEVMSLAESSRDAIVSRCRSGEIHEQMLTLLGAPHGAGGDWTVVAFQDRWPDPGLHVVCLSLGVTDGPCSFEVGAPRVLLVPAIGVPQALARVHAAALPGEDMPVFSWPIDQTATAEVFACLWDPVNPQSPYQNADVAFTAARALAGEVSLATTLLQEWRAALGETFGKLVIPKD